MYGGLIIMNSQLNNRPEHEWVSALMDGQLRGAELQAALARLDADDTRECWQLYHLVGDVLRSPDLAAQPADGAFMARLGARLAQEGRPAAPAAAPAPVQVQVQVRDPALPAANDGQFRWKMVAGLASFAAVAAMGWGVMSGAGLPAGAGAQLGQGAAPVAAGTRVATLAQPIRVASDAATTLAAADSGETGAPVMLRDPRLDELLAEHRQAVGVTALGGATGFLRNATFEGAGR